MSIWQSFDVPASEILNKGLIVGMDIVGEKMENGDMFIPEVLMAAKAMGSCVEILKPLLGEGEAAAGGMSLSEPSKETFMTSVKTLLS